MYTLECWRIHRSHSGWVDKENRERKGKFKLKFKSLEDMVKFCEKTWKSGIAWQVKGMTKKDGLIFAKKFQAVHYK